MVRGDRESWNIRAHHMTDTVDRLARHLGPHSKGLVWEHNSHVGDARATDMAGDGLVNVGQLLRERHPAGEVRLVGFASHHGTVLAATAWGGPERVLQLPPARAGSHEDLLHRALGEPSVLVFDDDRSGPWLSSWLGHRGGRRRVPTPTRGGELRHDPHGWAVRRAAVARAHRRPVPPAPRATTDRARTELEFETEPTGY